MKVGVIGLGWMGRVHLRNYSEMHGVDVVGVADVNREVLDEVSGQFGVPVFTEVDGLLAGDLDAVSICVPTVLHHEIGLKVLARGIPVLIEKPLAATVAQGEDLVRAARDKGLPLMVGQDRKSVV